jgi:hypothetical protein
MIEAAPRLDPPRTGCTDHDASRLRRSAVRRGGSIEVAVRGAARAFALARLAERRTGREVNSTWGGGAVL